MVVGSLFDVRTMSWYSRARFDEGDNVKIKGGDVCMFIGTCSDNAHFSVIVFGDRLARINNVDIAARSVT